MDSPAPAGSQRQLHHWLCSGPQGWTTEPLEHEPPPQLPQVPRKAAEAACCGLCPGCFATPVGPGALWLLGVPAGSSGSGSAGSCGLRKTFQDCLVGATEEFGDLQGHQWSVSGGKGHSLPLAGNAHNNPCMHISTLLFSKPLTGPRPFFCLVHCLHIQVTPSRGTYLLLAPLELEGQWDKALRTGHSRSFFPHQVRRSASLLLSPAPSACTVAPGIAQGPSGLGHGGVGVHGMTPLSGSPR